MPFLQMGQSAQINVPAGQSIRVGAFRNASASVQIPQGQPGGPSSTVQDGQSLFGPFTAQSTVNIVAAIGVVEYTVGVSPQYLASASGVNPVGYILAQSAVPLILGSSGASNATGQITLTTALPYTPAGTVSLYLPSGVVTAGSAGTGAGLYPVAFSSTTVCQIQGAGIVTANTGYTQTTASDITLATIPVPGGAMGPNGALRANAVWACANSAGNKTPLGKFAGSNFWGSAPLTTSGGLDSTKLIRNTGSQSNQVVQATFSTGAASSVAPSLLTVDTSQTQNITWTGNLAAATDYLILVGYSIEVLPG